MFSQEEVLKLLYNIKNSTDKRTIYKNLVEIRSDIVKNEFGIALFNKTDGIQICVDLIQKPHEQILEIALSIIGNCCTKKEGCIKAFEAGILPSLVSALKGLKNLNIQCRVCRILGNLAEHAKIASHIYDLKPAFALCSLLDPQYEIPVLLMAIRAIRILCNDKRFEDECISLGVIRKTTQILIHHTLAPNASEDEEPQRHDSETVIIKRMHSPDRTITKQKFQRYLDDIEHSRTDITGYEFVKTTQLQRDAKKFVMPVQKAAMELVTGILRFLHTVIRTLTMSAVGQMSVDSNSYKCLLFLSSQEASPFRTMALKIVSSLSENAHARNDLTQCDAVTVATNILMDKETLNEAEKRYCVTIICLLADCSSNRLKIRQSGVFNYLLAKMKSTSCNKERSLIFYGLYQFRYDQSGLLAMTENGAISTLIKILADKLELEQEQHSKTAPKTSEADKEKPATVTSEHQILEKKRRREMSPTANRFPKFSKFENPDSPGSTSSGFGSSPYSYLGPSSPVGSSYSFSPASTPPRPLDNEDDFDSERDYSPVCTDNEDEDEQQKEAAAELVPFDIFKAIGVDINDEIPRADEENSCFAADDGCASVPMEVDDTTKVDEPTLETAQEFEKNPIVSILTLMWMISNVKPCHAEFVKVTTLKTLLRVCCWSRNPDGKVGKMLLNIVSQINNFLKIIQQDFVFQLDDLVRPKYSHGSCTICDEMKVVGNKLLEKLATVAESGYGRGEIVHLFVKKTIDTDMNKRVACITTYIVQDPKILYQLLFQYNVLETVLNLIFDESEALANVAAVGLTLLARHLGLKFQGETEALEACDDSLPEKPPTLEPTSEVITFHVKDKQQFQINKHILTDNCDVFNSMFRNDFRESQHNEVHLEEISLDGIRYFCQLVELSAASRLDTATRPNVFGMQSALEAYELTIKYMLPDLEGVILKIIKSIMHDSSALAIFEWSLRNMNQDLLDTSIVYFLNCDIPGERKATLFRNANKSSFKKEWHQLIVDTIFNKCSPLLE